MRWYKWHRGAVFLSRFGEFVCYGDFLIEFPCNAWNTGGDHPILKVKLLVVGDVKPETRLKFPQRSVSL